MRYTSAFQTLWVDLRKKCLLAYRSMGKSNKEGCTSLSHIVVSRSQNTQGKHLKKWRCTYIQIYQDHGEASFHPIQIKEVAMRIYIWFSESRAVMEESKSINLGLGCASHESMYKTNFYAAVDTKQRCIGIGVVARDWNGKFIEAMVQPGQQG